MLSVWEERKVRLYGEHANVHQSHSQNDSGDLRGVAGGDGELGCLCGKAGTSHLCDGSAHSSGCVVNGYGCRLIIINPRRACAARVTVVVLCVVCVCQCVQAAHLRLTQLSDKLDILTDLVSWWLQNEFGVFRIMASFRR